MAVDIATAHLPPPERLSAAIATVVPLHPNGIAPMTPQIAMSVVIVDTDVHAIIALSAAVFATVRGRLIAGNLRGIPCGDLDHLHTVMTMLSMTENVQETGSDEIMVYSDSRLEVTNGDVGWFRCVRRPHSVC
jgi:hypothetical protein